MTEESPPNFREVLTCSDCKHVSEVKYCKCCESHMECFKYGTITVNEWNRCDSFEAPE